MIKIVGTSHVSKDSIERIDDEFEEFDPNIVCLELDLGRLNGLLTGEKSEPDSLLHRGLAWLQRYIGGKTGLMPGEEMLHAYRRADSKGLEVFLIDRDIRRTLQRLKSVRRKEKVLAILAAPLSLIFSDFNLDEIPEEDKIEKMKKTLASRFPELYKVLLEERDIYMYEAIKRIYRQNPEKDILVVVGAAHRRGLEERVDEFIDRESSVEEKQQKLEG
jgi:pheromone shutdown protein TraB